jgi:hypothetical protein
MHQRKVIETRALSAARSSGVPIPLREVPGEEPDFTFNERALGVEVSELLRPASGNSGIVPVAEECHHKEILQLAQREYYANPKARPARVILYFANSRGRRSDKREMALKLVEFVRANTGQARPIANFDAHQLPEGFSAASIASEHGDWWCGEGGNITLTDIREGLASIIWSKNRLVRTYRKNLAQGAQLWLLLYSTASVSRGLPIPHGIEEWQFDCEFDKVYWYVSLGSAFVEIHKCNR